jgi:hypothetical protein
LDRCKPNTPLITAGTVAALRSNVRSAKKALNSIKLVASEYAPPCVLPPNVPDGL